MRGGGSSSLINSKTNSWLIYRNLNTQVAHGVGLGKGEGWRLNNAGDVARPALYYSAWVCVRACVRSFISLSEQEHIILNDSIQRGKCIYMQ